MNILKTRDCIKFTWIIPKIDSLAKNILYLLYYFGAQKKSIVAVTKTIVIVKKQTRLSSLYNSYKNLNVVNVFTFSF